MHLLGPGARFGPYRVVRHLETAITSEHYAATQSDSKTHLLLKVARPQSAKMFAVEVTVARALHHPNIVETLDAGVVEGRAYLVQEQVQGTSYAALLERLRAAGQVMPVAAAIWIAHQMLLGLEQMHAARDTEGNPLGLVHRNITPRSVLLSSRGEVKLTGLSSAMGVGFDERTVAGMLHADLAYIAPEQLGSGTVDARADLFLTGLVLYVALRGPPADHPGGSDRVIDQVRAKTLPALTEHGASQELSDVVMQALAPEPRERFASARQFADALAGLLAQRYGGKQDMARQVADLVAGAGAALSSTAPVPPRTTPPVDRQEHPPLLAPPTPALSSGQSPREAAPLASLPAQHKTAPPAESAPAMDLVQERSAPSEGGATAGPAMTAQITAVDAILERVPTDESTIVSPVPPQATRTEVTRVEIEGIGAASKPDADLETTIVEAAPVAPAPGSSPSAPTPAAVGPSPGAVTPVAVRLSPRAVVGPSPGAVDDFALFETQTAILGHAASLDTALLQSPSAAAETRVAPIERLGAASATAAVIIRPPVTDQLRQPRGGAVLNVALMIAGVLIGGTAGVLARHATTGEREIRVPLGRRVFHGAWTLTVERARLHRTAAGASLVVTLRARHAGESDTPALTTVALLDGGGRFRPPRTLVVGRVGPTHRWTCYFPVSQEQHPVRLRFTLPREEPLLLIVSLPRPPAGTDGAPTPDRIREIERAQPSLPRSAPDSGEAPLLRGQGMTRPPPTTRRPVPDRGFGLLTLNAVPWAEVFVDGMRIGVTPLIRVRVPAGKRRIRLRNPERKLQRRIVVDVPRDGEVKRTIDL